MPDRRSDQFTLRRLAIRITGAVQGVGFRPFVYRLATRLGINGWVCNSSQGVYIDIEGSDEGVTQFLRALEKEPPPRARIEDCDIRNLDYAGYRSFEVHKSHSSGDKSVVILPDIATCPDCLREILDPADRRYQYPFTNCTNCGPRYSIIESLPYDRCNTTMKAFRMCDACRAEYENPADRRFHAQPNACPGCGPHLELWSGSSDIIEDRHNALLAACDAIAFGKILALKGLGGFQLIVDARNEYAVRRLRRRKNREAKPLALMFPDLAAVKTCCEVSEREDILLASHRAPIVLLRRLADISRSEIAPSVAPDNPYLGVMLPYTPLHNLMMRELGFPIVATSGNRSDEPICIDEREAIDRLGAIADLFLVHNRPIARQMDDSVVCVMHGQETVFRSARGYAPTPIPMTVSAPAAVALGGHLKNAVAIAEGRLAFLSQYVGDLDVSLARTAMRRVTNSLLGLYDVSAEVIGCDLHPDYASTRFAEEFGRAIVGVQHHYAHALSCMVDSKIETPFLAVTWDGTGLGTDGTIWGGEFLVIDADSYTRIGHMRRFRLPGGEAAIREPRRAAIGLLWELFDGNYSAFSDLSVNKTFAEKDLCIIHKMLTNNINCPVTSSAGRLFDVVASLLGYCHVNGFEGQAAMRLGFAAECGATDESYQLEFVASDETILVDWSPMIHKILEDIRADIRREIIAAKFHNSLVDAIAHIARRSGFSRVALTGGCFQNRYLTERAIVKLEEAGLGVFRHHRIPPNDGGLAAGQIVGVSRTCRRSD